MICLTLLKGSWEYSFRLLTLELSKNALSSMTRFWFYSTQHVPWMANFAFFTRINGSVFRELILAVENFRSP